MHPGCPLRFSGAHVDEPAHMVYVLLSTDMPIFASDFAQAGTRGAEAPPNDPLRALLWHAMAGTRGIGEQALPTVDWGASIVQFDVIADSSGN